jgi:hypothetical protein
LNSLFTWALDHKLFKGEKYPGVAATEQAVEGVRLKINCAMVNLSGFRHLVDTVGGVKLRSRPHPKGTLGDFDGKSPSSQLSHPERR